MDEPKKLYLQVGDLIQVGKPTGLAEDFCSYLRTNAIDNLIDLLERSYRLSPGIRKSLTTLSVIIYEKSEEVDKHILNEWIKMQR